MKLVKRRTPLKKMSDKQRQELARRSKLKKEYMEETEGHCHACHTTGDKERGASNEKNA